MHKQLSVVLIFWKLSISIATENIYLIITQSVISRVWRCAVLVMISWSVFYLQTPAEKTSAIMFLSCIHMKNIILQKIIFESVL